MNISVAIVGLPNVGKSTLFNALVKTAQAEAANFPFCTIEPNKGIVAVPDSRLQELAKVAHSGRIVPAAVEFVDIAGLVRGASKGQGLGNKFLSHIRECAAIVMVVRLFPDPNIVHVAGKIDPLDDIKTINLELILADLQTVEKALGAAQSAAKTGNKDAIALRDSLDKVYKHLEAEKPVRNLELSEEEQELLKSYQLLTAKPVIYVANVSEEQLQKSNTFDALLDNISILSISAKIEAELAGLSEEEQREYLASLGLQEPGLDRLIKKAYEVLGLISFFTAGELEARAWTIRAGTNAQNAAGVIHTDFIKKFIKAEVTDYKTFMELGGWQGAKEKGKVRLEGKEYVMREGDVVYFKIGA